MAAAKAKKSAVRVKTAKSSRQSAKGKTTQKKRVAASKKRPQRAAAPKRRPQKPAPRPSPAKKKKVLKRPATPIRKPGKKSPRVAAKAIRRPAKAVKAIKKVKQPVKAAKGAGKIKQPVKAAVGKMIRPTRGLPVKAVPSPKTALSVKPPAPASSKSAPKAAAPAKGSTPAKVAPPVIQKAVGKTAAKSGADGTRKRGRTRIPHDTGPLAAWLPQPTDPRPRPSSFIPAPPRAESPFTTAAPPASSDRLIRPDDLVGLDKAIRTFPIRVDVEQGAGRTFVGAMPSEISIKAGDGIEWDFRYLGGADATVQEVIIEIDKPSPFSKLSFRSHKPGSARPHRQLSGPATASSKGRRFRYTIRCLNWIKAEVAKAICTIQVTE